MRHSCLLWCLVFLPLTARAEDAFFAVPIQSLQITDGKLPGPATQPSEWDWQADNRPYAVIEGGEAFVRAPNQGQPAGNDLMLYVRMATNGAVKGKLFLAESDAKKLVPVSFTIAGDGAKPDARKAFYEAQLQHYTDLINESIPGGAWFRYRANEAEKALDRESKEPNARANRPPRGSDVEETYSFFTGGRAVAENLQLDRAIAASKDEKPGVDVSSIKGLSVAEIDWQPLIKDLHPQLDPLASILPDDQHAIFSPSFEAFQKVLDTVDARGTPVAQLVESRAEDAGSKERYQRQLGLQFSTLAKLLGPTMVDSVAITGGDPFLRDGSDVAILFQTKAPDVLSKLLQAKIALADPKAARNEGDVEGLHFTSFTGGDLMLRSFVAATDGAVIISNSQAQIARLAQTIAKKSAALATSPEYIFFRSRYARGDESESALIVVTDATIRRWCGPRWRIADSRRIRAAAIMNDLEAQNADALISGGAAPQIDPSEVPQDLGEVSFAKNGIYSSVYGSLDFLTPVSELTVDQATKGEKESYERWRDQYQQYWRWAFDPIALRLTVNDKQLAGDLTIRPLIADSDYDSFVTLSRGVKLDANSGDPHEDLWHLVVALNPKSEPIHEAESFFTQDMMKMGANPLAWIGTSAAVYADDDPFWAEFAKQDPDKSYEFVEKNPTRLPVAVYVASSNPLKLTLFLTAVRAFVEQSAPQMTQWQPLRYHDRAYVKISPTEEARKEEKDLEKLAVYYAATTRGLTVSLNEQVIQRALDRQIASTQPSAQPATQPAAPWLGDSAALHAKVGAIDLLQRVLAEQYIDILRQRSWSNLPILNEWKRRYPNEDPVKVHARLFAVQLVEPAGGTYAWNEHDQTMESSMFGSPTNPKNPQHVPMLLEGFSAFDGGVTFEDKGLRARARLARTSGGN
jgi:hypothetical protein